MMSEYVEIETTKEISRLNRTLSTKLRRDLHRTENRVIGYPQGSFVARVGFLSDAGDDVFWWAGGSYGDKSIAHNYFGHGTPGSKASLNIDVQFNVPAVKFARNLGGTFLRHGPTGKTVLAHRGIVTLGHGRVKKSDLFAEIAATIREAETSKGTAELLLIGELESPTLINEIDAFSHELRRTVKAIKTKSVIDRKPGAGGRKSQPATTLGKLREYFDEFSGQRILRGRRKTTADCYHGTVVRALRDALVGTSEVLKNREIDLIALTGKRAFMFEVKTSADTQSIYTAIGQLSAHAPVVTRLADNKRLDKVIVLPKQPAKQLRKIITDHLGIRILEFARSKKGHISIDGLHRLSDG